MIEFKAQLDRVSKLSRMLLLGQRVFQAFSALLIIALVCGVSDYLLRLPSVVRLVSDLIVVVLGSLWLVTRMIHVYRFKPTPTQLALRAEAMYPHLKHKFASAVDFLMHHPSLTHSQAMRHLEDLSLDQAEHQLQDVNLTRLLNPIQTLRYACLFVGMLIIMGTIYWASPVGCSLAMARWLKPLGDAQWPRRVQIVSLNEQAIWPADSPLLMQLIVQRGDRKSMRAWLNYRYITQGRTGDWQSVLMNRQGQNEHENAQFERLINLADDLQARDLPAQIEFYYQAGDGLTKLQQVQIVARPKVKSVQLQITPPAYAMGMIGEQNVIWENNEQLTSMLRSTRVLEGSTLAMKLVLNKSVRVQSPSEILPALSDVENARVSVDDALPNVLNLQWSLLQTLQSPIHIQDEHGLSNQSEQQYRIEAIADQLPSVSLVKPMQDVFVLSGATIDVQATARDDVSLERLTLSTQLQKPQSKLQTLASQAGRQSELTVDAKLIIKNIGGVPGDVFELKATAQDSYQFNDKKHEPVHASSRLVYVIDEEKFTQQIRNELGVVRQMALRLSAEQQLLEKAPSATAKPRQKRLTDQLEQHQKTIKQINERMTQNNLKSQALQQIVSRAAGLLKQAQQASKQATEQLDQPQRQASASLQRKVSKNLVDLVELLDQGRDALTLQLQLQQMQNQQQDLLDQSRKLLPKTLGKTAEQLDKQTQKQVDELAQQQQALSEKAKNLLNKMRQTAERLSQQEQAQDKASAQSLSEAASTAQRKGLQQKMQQASKSASENKLSQTQQQQKQSLDIMEQMRQQMAQQSKRKQAILKRQMAKLAELLAALAKRQKIQIEILPPTADLLSLVEPQVLLRQNTISVQDQAMSNQQTQLIAQVIEQAITEQANAVTQMRQQNKPNTKTHEVQALAHLNNALDAIKEAQKKAEKQAQQEQRDELQKAYVQLADLEKQLAVKVKPYVDLDQVNRRHRRDLRGLSTQQDDLKLKINELKEKVEQTTLFKYLHDKINDNLTQTVTQLRKAQSLSDAHGQQMQTVSRLLQMAKVLQMQSEQEKFSNAQDGDNSGGGGSGGSSKSSAMVPPIAELRLLREIQIDLHQQTQHAQKQNATQAQIKNISIQQQELAVMGQKLIDKLTPPSPEIKIPEVKPSDTKPEGGAK